MTRRGLVIGAGGVLGFAWVAGALAALEREEGFDCRDADMLVGTSAGSITAALLACGVPVDAIVRHHQGIPAPGDPVVDYDEEIDGSGPMPPLPAFSLGSPSLLARVALHPRTVPPLAALSSLLPRGRASLAGIHRLVSGLTPEPGWASHPALWVVAMDYESGRRVVFGRPGSPEASLADAVTASCAVPGWFAPVEINGRCYVDGGTCSTASLDLLAGQGLDEVYVVTPMASFAYDAPSTLATRVERRVRRALSRRLMREAEKVRASGTRVTMLGPGPEDLAAIGSNMMDGRRRAAVLTTSLRTSAEALRAGVDLDAAVVPYPPLADLHVRSESYQEAEASDLAG